LSSGVGFSVGFSVISRHLNGAGQVISGCTEAIVICGPGQGNVLAIIGLVVGLSILFQAGVGLDQASVLIFVAAGASTHNLGVEAAPDSISGFEFNRLRLASSDFLVEAEDWNFTLGGHAASITAAAVAGLLTLGSGVG